MQILPDCGDCSGVISVVVVTEGSRGIMLRFNKVQRDAENKVVVYEPGLHFKLPLIDSIKVLDARIHP